MAEEAARNAGGGRIAVVRLRVGALSSAVPDAMRFAWETLRQGTLAAGATLEIETVEPSCWCDTCQAEFEARDFVNECPQCRRLSGRLQRGRELELAAVELE